MTRVELYQKILESLSIHITDKGELASPLPNGELNPIVFKNRPFYLPTTEVLGIPISESENFLYFDVLNESAISQDSDSLKLLRNAMLSKLSLSASLIVTELVKILQKKDLPVKLNSRQLTLTREGFKVTQKTLRSIANLMRDGVNQSAANKIVNIFTKRGADFEDVRYSRLAVVDFPILKELDSDTNTIFGVEMDSKDKVAILSLFKFILQKPEKYTMGSNSLDAPGFQSLCLAYANVANRLNEVNSIFKSIYIPSKKNETPSDKIHLNIKWVDDIQDLEDFSKDPLSLQSLPGTRGDDVASLKSKETNAKSNQREKVVIDVNIPDIEDTPPWDDVDSQTQPQPLRPSRTTNVSENTNNDRSTRDDEVNDFGVKRRVVPDIEAPVRTGDKRSSYDRDRDDRRIRQSVRTNNSYYRDDYYDRYDDRRNERFSRYDRDDMNDDRYEPRRTSYRDQFETDRRPRHPRSTRLAPNVAEELYGDSRARRNDWDYDDRRPPYRSRYSDRV